MQMRPKEGNAAVRRRRRQQSGHLVPVLLCAVMVALGWPPETLSAAEIRGKVQLVTPSGKPAKERTRVLVHYTPATDASSAATPSIEVPSEPFELTMARKQFQPSSLIIPKGSTVRFPNDDTILHNVFSVSGRNRFDLGFYRQGTGKEAIFDHPGVVRVFCNVHHSMVAHILVVDTPYYGVTDASGNFKLTGVPAGRGTLTLWFERSDELRREITVPTAQSLALDLVVTKSKLPPHRNKFNKPYKRRRGGKAYN